MRSADCIDVPRSCTFTSGPPRTPGAAPELLPLLRPALCRATIRRSPCRVPLGRVCGTTSSNGRPARTRSPRPPPPPWRPGEGGWASPLELADVRAQPFPVDGWCVACNSALLHCRQPPMDHLPPHASLLPCHTAARRQAVVEHQHSWDPAEYEFDPYNLTAVHVNEAASPSKAVGCSAGPAPAQDAAAAAAEAPPVKRRPGRQRRTSVLCQVCSVGHRGASLYLHSASRWMGHFVRLACCSLADCGTDCSWLARAEAVYLPAAVLSTRRCPAARRSWSMPRSTTDGTASASGTALCELHEPWLELGVAAACRHRLWVPHQPAPCVHPGRQPNSH